MLDLGPVLPTDEASTVSTYMFPYAVKKKFQFTVGLGCFMLCLRWCGCIQKRASEKLRHVLLILEGLFFVSLYMCRTCNFW